MHMKLSSTLSWSQCVDSLGRVTHICVSKLTIIGSDNGLSTGRRQANIWTNVGILLIVPLWTNFSEILIEIHAISFKKIPFENVACETATILSRPQWANYICTIYLYITIIWLYPIICVQKPLFEMNKWQYSVILNQNITFPVKKITSQGIRKLYFILTSVC